MRSLIPLALIALTAVASGAPGPKDAPAKEAPDIAGEWVLVSLSIGGQAIPLEFVAGRTEFTAAGKRVEHNRKGDDVMGERFFKLDRKASPPTIDFSEKIGGPITTRGIYGIDGDMLKICSTPVDPAIPRPTKLEAPAGSKFVLAEYKRVKKN